MFKNIYIYQLKKPFALNQNELGELLSTAPFTPLASTELQRSGWVDALPVEHSGFCQDINGSLFVCMRKEEKILPAHAVNKEIKKLTDLFEKEQNRKPNKKEKAEFKDAIIFDLLPRAFTKITDTRSYINVEQNIIVIDVSSENKAEEFLSLLRETLGSLSVEPLCYDYDPADTMTDWVSFKVKSENVDDGDFILGEELVLNDVHGGRVSFSKLDLSAEDVRTKIIEHLNNEMFVVKVEFYYELMAFVLCRDMSIKKIRHCDDHDSTEEDDCFSSQKAAFETVANTLNEAIPEILLKFDIDTKQLGSF